MYFGTNIMVREATGGKITAHTSGGLAEEGGLAEGQVAVMARGNLSSYSVTSREPQRITANPKDNRFVVEVARWSGCCGGR